MSEPAFRTGAAALQEAYVSNRTVKNSDRFSNRGEGAAYLGEDRGTRARAEALLARYPRLDSHELQALLHWYRREASAMDVALVASSEHVGERYRQFHHDHLRRFSWKEKLITAALAMGIAAMLAMGLMPEAA
jgi:hypothetical protein